ncbi:MAG: hypothetical protein R6X02_28185 [Enhygromyxa sp.]
MAGHEVVPGRAPEPAEPTQLRLLPEVDGLYGGLLPVPVGATVTLGLAREEVELVRVTAVATLRR